MSNWTTSRAVGVALFVWSIAMVGFLVKELFRLLETGSGLIAVVSSFGVFAGLYLGPPLLVSAGLFVDRLIRKGGYAA
jgi:hypothetical protein